MLRLTSRAFLIELDSGLPDPHLFSEQFFVLATLFILAALVSSCESESVPKDSALFINPTGQLVEQTSRR